MEFLSETEHDNPVLVSLVCGCLSYDFSRMVFVLDLLFISLRVAFIMKLLKLGSFEVTNPSRSFNRKGPVLLPKLVTRLWF